jgi:predicted TIM-barrel fold metal-dependent hydrolase
MIIDCHVHTVNEEIYNQYMKKTHADISIYIRDYSRPGTDELFYSLINDKENLYGVEYIDYYKGIEEQLNRIKERLNECKKIVGIKLFPGYYPFYPSDELMYPVYEFAEKNNLVVIFHTGDVLDLENKSLLKFTHPIHVDEVATKFKNVKFVISHFGFPYLMETAMIVNKNPNVYTDISGTADSESVFEFYKTELKRVLGYFPEVINKIMHGTDFCGDDTPLNNTAIYERLVRETFSLEDQSKVFYHTAKELYKI